MRRLHPRRLIDGGGQGPEAEPMRALLEQISQEESPPAVAENALRARIWSRLEAGERRAHANWNLIFAGAAGLAIALFAFAFLREPAKLDRGGEAIDRAEAKTAQHLEPARETQTASAGSGHIFSGTEEMSPRETVPAGAWLHTAANGGGAIRVAGAGAVLARANTTFSLDANGPQALVHLAQGELFTTAEGRPGGKEWVIEVGPLGDAAPFRVRIGGSLVFVRATAFGASVDVRQGVVMIEQGARVYRVSGGQSWSAAAPEKIDAFKEPGTFPDWIAGTSRPVPSASDGAAGGATALAAAQPEKPAKANPSLALAANSRLRDQDKDTKIKDTKVVGTPIFATPSIDGAADSPSGAGSANGAQAASLPEIAPPSRPPILHNSEPSPEVQTAPRVAVAESDPYRRAEQLLAQGKAAQAAEAFGKIVAGNGVHRELALYELGRIQQRDLGDRAGALQSFRAYQASYPRGALAQEVALSLIDLELDNADASDRSAAFDGIGDFLSEHPNSERAAEMHLLRGNLLRERGDCERAIADYAQASGLFAGDALYFTAFCERKMGRLDDAKRSLNDYLQRFSTGLHRAEAEAALAAAAQP